jgi:hypothetical protein
MRGLALATLFLGLCLVDPGPDIHDRMATGVARLMLFIAATIFILAGA